MKKMLPWALMLVMSVLTGCCSAPQRTQTSPVVTSPIDSSNIIQATMDMTVALVTRDNDNDVVPFCTGVWVSENQIVTAHHCIQSRVLDLTLQGRVVKAVGLGVDYVTQGGVTGMYKEPLVSHAAQVTHIDPAHDLALLKAVINIPTHRVAVIADGDPLVGEDLHVVGQTGGLYWTYSRAYVSAVRPDKWVPVNTRGPLVQVVSAAWFGNSGGGAFNNKGELVGIASFMMRPPSIIFFIHSSRVKDLLNSAN